MYCCLQYVDCKSNNLIYLLSCKRCCMQYVGETQRCWEYFRKIKYFAHPKLAPLSKRNKEAEPVPSHFGQRGHSVDDVQVNIVQFIRMDPNEPCTVLQKTCRISEYSQSENNGTIWYKCDDWGPPDTQYLKFQFFYGPQSFTPHWTSWTTDMFKRAPNTIHSHIFIWPFLKRNSKELCFMPQFPYFFSNIYFGD